MLLSEKADVVDLSRCTHLRKDRSDQLYTLHALRLLDPSGNLKVAKRRGSRLGFRCIQVDMVHKENADRKNDQKRAEE